MQQEWVWENPAETNPARRRNVNVSFMVSPGWVKTGKTLRNPWGFPLPGGQGEPGLFTL